MYTKQSKSKGMFETYRVSVEQYHRFREQGFLVIKNLVPAEDISEMNNHMDSLLAGREFIEGAKIMKNLNIDPMKPEDWLRVHMLHRLSPLHERFLLHPLIPEGRMTFLPARVSSTLNSAREW